MIVYFTVKLIDIQYTANDIMPVYKRNILIFFCLKDAIPVNLIEIKSLAIV